MQILSKLYILQESLTALTKTTENYLKSTTKKGRTKKKKTQSKEKHKYHKTMDYIETMTKKSVD